MTATVNNHKLRSPLFAKILYGILLVAMVPVIIFAIWYGQALNAGDENTIAAFLERKWTLINLAPFAAVVVPFFLSLWMYSFYIDAINVFHKFSRSPQDALLRVVIPGYNIYGIGRSFSLFINFLDREDDEVYRDLSFSAKAALTWFYAGFGAVVLTLGLNLSLPGTVEAFTKPGMIAFYITGLVFILMMVLGLAFSVFYMMKILKYRASKHG